MREATPRKAMEIQNRINEISFNSSLLRELRAINFVKRLLAEGALHQGSMKDILVHLIADDVMMQDLSVATKLMPNPYVLGELKEAGRVACDRFLAAHYDDLNVRSSTDLRAMFG
jgi:NTE family protein